MSDNIPLSECGHKGIKLLADNQSIVSPSINFLGLFTIVTLS